MVAWLIGGLRMRMTPSALTLVKWIMMQYITYAAAALNSHSLTVRPLKEYDWIIGLHGLLHALYSKETNYVITTWQILSENQGNKTITQYTCTTVCIFLFIMAFWMELWNINYGNQTKKQIQEKSKGMVTAMGLLPPFWSRLSTTTLTYSLTLSSHYQ